MNSAPPPFTLPASFVHLTPLNIKACQAFNDVALLVKNIGLLSTPQGSAGRVRHPAKFMIIELWTRGGPAGPAASPGPGPSQPASPQDLELSLPSSSEALAGIENTSSPLPEPEELQYQGFYDLSFKNLPDIPRTG